MRDDLVRAVDLVRQGRSYRQAAEAVGVTRNAVAGACHRAGVKMDPDAASAHRSTASSVVLKHRWVTNKAFAQAHAERARATMHRLNADLSFRKAASERLRRLHTDPDFVKAIREGREKKKRDDNARAGGSHGAA